MNPSSSCANTAGIEKPIFISFLVLRLAKLLAEQDIYCVMQSESSRLIEKIYRYSSASLIVAETLFSYVSHHASLGSINLEAYN